MDGPLHTHSAHTGRTIHFTTRNTHFIYHIIIGRCRLSFVSRIPCTVPVSFLHVDCCGRDGGRLSGRLLSVSFWVCVATLVRIHVIVNKLRCKNVGTTFRATNEIVFRVAKMFIAPSSSSIVVGAYGFPPLLGDSSLTTIL